MELSFRHIKSTLQMDHLSCRTPEMVDRELRMHLLAHNLIRRIGLEASRRLTIPVDRVSFAGTMAAMNAYSQPILFARTQKMRRTLENEMYQLIAGDPVPLRPGRREPRAVKRRPKPYPRLMTHRRHFKYNTDHS